MHTHCQKTLAGKFSQDRSDEIVNDESTRIDFIKLQVAHKDFIARSNVVVFSFYVSMFVIIQFRIQFY